MARTPYKHDIEYIQKYYSYGSEAKVIEFKPLRKQPKTKLPKPGKERVTKIYVDPVALCGLLVAAVMIVVMTVGIIRFGAACEEYQSVKSYLTVLQDKNVQLRHTYHTGYDLAEIEETALALGMVPVDQVKTIAVDVTIPEPEGDPSMWDNFIWFISGLFA